MLLRLSILRMLLLLTIYVTYGTIPLRNQSEKEKWSIIRLADNHVHQLVKVAYDHATEGDAHWQRLRKTEYRLENLTCASCAMKFENNVKNLPAVRRCASKFRCIKIIDYRKCHYRRS